MRVEAKSIVGRDHLFYRGCAFALCVLALLPNDARSRLRPCQVGCRWEPLRRFCASSNAKASSDCHRTGPHDLGSHEEAGANSAGLVVWIVDASDANAMNVQFSKLYSLGRRKPSLSVSSAKLLRVYPNYLARHKTAFPPCPCPRLEIFRSFDFVRIRL
jgi:hypothetical protein